MTNMKKVVVLAGDIAVLYLSLVVMLLLRYEPGDFPYRLGIHLVPFSVVFALWIGIAYLNGLYRFQIRGVGEHFRALLNVVVISSSASIIVFYVWTDFFELTPKTNLLIFGALFLALDFGLRTVLQRFLAPKTLNIVVLGQSPLISETVAYIRDNRREFDIVAWIRDFKQQGVVELAATIRERKLHIAVIQPHLKDDAATMQSVYSLLPLRIVLISFWDFYEYIFKKVPLDELKEGWFIENIARRNPFYDIPKRLFDAVFSILATLLLLPIGLVISILIKLGSKGPVIYRQVRAGKNGKEFVLYKFRTMKHNSQGPYWTVPEDERITLLGKYLRFTHLDEIPQLLNIIAGDLSFIGPRPERLELAQQYELLPYYNMRHIGRPGLTGWAQINFRPSASLEEAHEKLRYDIYYIKNRSHILDLYIMLMTIKYLLTKPR
ncbi:MAG: exopolysaccharide biosynthesis polyprenyl glycosylphosphotransferase [Candidatus Marinimicrobia bacterium]|nr:exopolysaccharide biosynthesis polyprenyl glycosylphosphotransferase [Candidatus Neomarinimicrobiota bacterium]